MNTTDGGVREGGLHPLQPGLPASGRKRRRWWVYLLWVLGVLFVLGLTLIVSVAIYWNHLVKTYTSTQPKEVPTVEGNEERYGELRDRWEAYALLYLRPQERPDFELSADDLNLFAARFGPLRKRAYLEVLPDRLRVRFSAPLDGTGNPSLHSRYLNGVADLKVELKPGRLSVRLQSLEANGKPVPGWILRRLQKVNWGERINHRPEFDLVVRGMERLELQAGSILLHPKPGMVPAR